MGPNGIVWHYGYMRPALPIAADGGFQNNNLGNHQVDAESEDSEYEDSEEDEQDHASNEAQDGSAEDEGQGPVVDHSVNLAIANGPVGAEGSDDSLGSSPECRLE